MRIAAASQHVSGEATPAVADSDSSFAVGLLLSAVALCAAAVVVLRLGWRGQIGRKKGMRLRQTEDESAGAPTTNSKRTEEDWSGAELGAVSHAAVDEEVASANREDDLLSEFRNMSRNEQIKLAKALGTTRAAVLKALNDAPVCSDDEEKVAKASKPRRLHEDSTRRRDEPPSEQRVNWGAHDDDDDRDHADKERPISHSISRTIEAPRDGNEKERKLMSGTPADATRAIRAMQMAAMGDDWD